MPTNEDTKCFVIIDSDFRPRIKGELLKRLTQKGISLKNLDTLEFNISNYDTIRHVIDECIEDKVASLNEISIDSY